MEVGSSVSRRTRRQAAEYWQSRHNEIKKITDQESRKHDTFGASLLVVDSDSSKTSVNDDDNDNNDEDYGKKRSRKPFGPPKKKARVDNGGARGEGFGDDDGIDGYDSDWGNKRKAGPGPKKKKGGLGKEPGFGDVLEGLIGGNVGSVEEGCLLPLKFSLRDDDEELAEKTDWEKEIDSLFDDMEMGLYESEMSDLPDSSTVDGECHGTNENDESPIARCRRGEHDHYLDEQIGIVCQCCFSVLLDIKHVFPPFYVESPEKHQKEDRGGSKNSIMDQIQFLNSCSNDLESSSLHSTGTVFDLIPKSSKELYPHQLDGFGFLWRNIGGGTHLENLRRLHSTGGQGCIISHAPGTGKTRLTIVFLQTFLKLYPNCRPMIVAPCGMLLTWEQELKKWGTGIDFHNLNESTLSDQENETFAALADESRVDGKNRDYIRFVKLVSWMKGGSILGIGYRLFAELAGVNRGQNSKFKKVLLEVPGLFVMDEGHTPRNDQSQIWKALTKIRTQRRVILSGTPFQNNLRELHNTLCLVNPAFSGSHKVSRKPGRKGKCDVGRDEWTILMDSISKDDTKNEALKKLRLMIEPFVHIHKGSILQKALPGMKDCLIILKPTDLQKNLLQKIKTEKYLEQAHIDSLISIHPSLVANRPEASDQARNLRALESDPKAGAKTHFLINLIQLSTRLNEKVLIFSEFIPPLLHIKSLLKLHFKWHEGREIMYMDGEIGSKQRQHSITSFNDRNGRGRVMLASVRACKEGINLVGASRVVLLDVAWNPAVERQAICRAYRIGQEKMVYVYHLVTEMEVKRYGRQAAKEQMSELVFQGGDGGTFSSKDVGEDKVLDAMVGIESIRSMITDIVNQPKESDLVNTFGFVDLR